jgi:uncharacterized membrane protein YkvA (DUF1232 family)
MSFTTRRQAEARRLRREVHALYLACRDPRVPWYAKTLAAGIVAYAFSPIDLIPDFIPVLGYLDELVLLPLGVLAVRALIAGPVMTNCRERADAPFSKVSQSAESGPLSSSPSGCFWPSAASSWPGGGSRRQTETAPPAAFLDIAAGWSLAYGCGPHADQSPGVPSARPGRLLTRALST